MPRTFTIGGLDTAAYALREGVALPLIDSDIPVQEWVTDCLQQAVVERRGVILLAPHGAGKSIAIKRDLLAFDRLEQQRRTVEAAYEPRRVVALTTVRATTARELFISLYRAAFDVAPSERVYRRKKDDDELRNELVARCEAEQVVAFIVDEAQTLTPEALEALRDLMAVAETSAAGRLEALGTEHAVRPGGIGVLLVATMTFYPRLQHIPEFGRRWVRVETVGALDDEAVPGLLARLLPAFAEGARQLGEATWADLVYRTVLCGRHLCISTLHDIAHTYVRRAAAEQPAARKVAELGWDEDLFRHAVSELVGFTILGQEAA